MSRLNMNLADTTACCVGRWWDNLNPNVQKATAALLGVPENSWSWGEAHGELVMNYWEALELGQSPPSLHLHVMDYNTGNALPGKASLKLIMESMASHPTGAVPAYKDENDVWQYVQPSQVTHYERHLKLTCETVWVELQTISV